MTFKWLVILLVVGISAKAQQTHIQFYAPAFAGRSISIVTELDPISQRDSVLVSTNSSSNGEASLALVNFKKIGAYQIRVGRFIAPIYLEPGGKYQITLIDNPTNALISTGQPGSFEYSFDKLDSTDINSAIIAFDQWYFQTQVEFASNRKLSQLEAKCAKALPTWVNRHSSQFYQTYVNYSMAELLLVAGANRSKLYETYLQESEIQVENPGWYSFFDNYFADYFQSFDTRFKGKTIYNRMKTGMPADSLDILLAQVDTTLSNPDLRHLVSLNSIAQTYSDPHYPKSSSVKWVEFIRTNSTSIEIKAIAKALVNKIQGSPVGSNFALYFPEFADAQAAMIDLPIYIFISEPDQKASAKESSLLEALYKEYGDFFQILEISMNEKNSSDKKPWPKHMVSRADDLMNKLNIYSFPYSLWLDSDGSILENGTVLPSTGLDQRLYKLRSDWREADKIKVGN